MLSEQEIQQALRASRVAPVPIANPHGPFGWEHLAQTLARFLDRDDIAANAADRTAPHPD